MAPLNRTCLHAAGRHHRATAFSTSLALQSLRCATLAGGEDTAALSGTRFHTALPTSIAPLEHRVSEQLPSLLTLLFNRSDAAFLPMAARGPALLRAALERAV
jgi:hypothetical protein